MDEATMRRRVRVARVGRLGTVTPDGRPHVVPCCFTLTGDVVHTAVDDVKPKASLALRRLDNIAANPAVTLLVDHYEDDWSALWWVRVAGEARVVGDGAEREAAVVGLAAKYDQYRRQPPPGPVLALTVARWQGWAFRPGG